MSEFGFTPPDQINGKLNAKFAGFTERKAAAKAQIEPATDALRSLNLGPEAMGAIDDVLKAIVGYQRYVMDERWLLGMNDYTPGITDQRMIDVWDGKDKAAEGLPIDDIRFPTESTPDETSDAALERLIQEPSDPWTGLTARYEEAIRVTRGLYTDTEEAKDRLEGIILYDPAAVDAAKETQQLLTKYTEAERDKTWVRALVEHPRADTQSVVEVWDAIESSQDSDREE